MRLSLCIAYGSAYILPDFGAVTVLGGRQFDETVRIGIVCADF